MRRRGSLARLVLTTTAIIGLTAGPVLAAPAATASRSPGAPQRGLAELLQIRDSVPLRQPFASAAGSSLSVWYPDPATGTVIVGVTRVTPAIVAAARSTWGSTVRVVQRDRPQVATRVSRVTRTLQVASSGKSLGKTAAPAPATAPAPSRLLDAPPYYGGTRIGVPDYPSAGYITECTAAFSNATKAMLSAGHCFRANTVVQQGYLDGTTWNYTGNMGKVDWVQWGTDRPDAEQINPALVGQQGVATPIYNTLTTSVQVNGNAYRYSIGAPFCTDGSFTGEKCKGVVDSANICANENDNGTTVRVCNLISGHSTDGSRLVQHGDSGGPVYAKVTGGVARSGIINAGNVASGQAGNQVYFTDLGVICQTYTKC